MTAAFLINAGLSTSDTDKLPPRIPAHYMVKFQLLWSDPKDRHMKRYKLVTGKQGMLAIFAIFTLGFEKITFTFLC